MNVNTNGVLFTAQAAGRQMARFGNRGSIVLIASISGSVTLKVRNGRMRRFPHDVDVNPSLRPIIWDHAGVLTT